MSLLRPSNFNLFVVSMAETTDAFMQGMEYASGVHLHAGSNRNDRKRIGRRCSWLGGQARCQRNDQHKQKKAHAGNELPYLHAVHVRNRNFEGVSKGKS